MGSYIYHFLRGYHIDFQLQLPSEWSKRYKITCYVAIPEFSLKNYFTMAEIYDSFLLSPNDIALCWKYRFWLDFKIESVLFLIITLANQEKK